MNWILCEDPGTLLSFLQSVEKCTNEEAEESVFVTVQLLDWTSAVLSLGTLRRPRIFLWVTQQSKNHGWPNRRRRFYAKQTTSYLLLFQEFSISSGSNSSSTSTSQDLSSTSPAQERSDELAPRECCGSPSETQNKNRKSDDSRDADNLRDLPEWLEELTDNLEDTELYAPAHSSGLWFGTSNESRIEIRIKAAQH